MSCRSPRFDDFVLCSLQKKDADVSEAGAHGIRFAYRNLDHDDLCSAKHEGIAASDAGDVSHTYKRNRRNVSEGRWNSSVLARSKRDSIRISMGSTSPNDKWANGGKMNVLSVVVDTIATISAILHLAWCGLHL